MIKITESERIADEIKNLTELELSELLGFVADHLRKEKLEHLIEQSFQIDDSEEEIAHLNEKVEDLENENSEFIREDKRLTRKIYDAIDEAKKGIKDNASDAEVELPNKIIEILEE